MAKKSTGGEPAKKAVRVYPWKDIGRNRNNTLGLGSKSPASPAAHPSDALETLWYRENGWSRAKSPKKGGS